LYLTINKDVDVSVGIEMNSLWMTQMI